jgi:hypothetical protein
VGQLSCELERGDTHSPFLMINHWADVFPPRSSPNEPFQTEREILRRAKQCQRERGLPVSLIAVDHYELGSLVPAVDALNAERIQRLRRLQAAARSG